jgi:hypothetical protein
MKIQKAEERLKYIKELRILVPNLPEDFIEQMKLRAIYSGNQDPNYCESPLSSIM